MTAPRATLHVWEGVADAPLAAIVADGTRAYSLVLQLSSGATGFERDGGERCLLALGGALVLVSMAGAERLRSGTAIARSRACTPQAWLFVDPTRALDPPLDALAAWIRARAAHDLALRLGRERPLPEAPPLVTLLVAPTPEVLASALTWASAVAQVRHGGAWGMYVTLLTRGDGQARCAYAAAASGAAVRRSPTRADLPSW